MTAIYWRFHSLVSNYGFQRHGSSWRARADLTCTRRAAHGDVTCTLWTNWKLHSDYINVNFQV